ncbi:calmodulin-like isoform X2 [Ptychodera flava]|uniref:calmodulin-like isoform X2 n=1 Tax=Ptychodera flava TaxID=63121 RepID=UPI003969EBB7
MDAARLNELKDVFSLFDKDTDGAITVRELETILRIMGPLITEHEIQEIIRNRKDSVTVESDHVDFPEFLTIMASRMTGEDNSQSDATKAVHVFQKDRRGFVKTSEVRNILTQVGEKLTDDEIQEFISELDTNNDGLIKYDELMKALV